MGLRQPVLQSGTLSKIEQKTKTIPPPPKPLEGQRDGQQLRALTTLLEDPGLISSTHTAAQDSIQTHM